MHGYRCSSQQLISMSEPPMISPSQPHGQLQRRTYMQASSIVPRSTMLRGDPKRVVTTAVFATIVAMLPREGTVYSRCASTRDVIVFAASGAWKYRP